MVIKSRFGLLRLFDWLTLQCLFLTETDWNLSGYLKVFRVDFMLNIIIHSYFFKSKFTCGDRTGCDSSHIRVIEVVLCPGSINQLHQWATHKSQNSSRKQYWENIWNYIKSPPDESLSTKANMLDFTYKAYYLFYNIARDPCWKHFFSDSH